MARLSHRHPFRAEHELKATFVVLPIATLSWWTLASLRNPVFGSREGSSRRFFRKFFGGTFRLLRRMCIGDSARFRSTRFALEFRIENAVPILCRQRQSRVRRTSANPFATRVCGFRVVRRRNRTTAPNAGRLGRCVDADRCADERSESRFSGRTMRHRVRASNAPTARKYLYSALQRIQICLAQRSDSEEEITT